MLILNFLFFESTQIFCLIFTKCSFYFTYIINLNYWNTNIIYILLIGSVFIKYVIKFIGVFFFVFFLNVSCCTFISNFRELFITLIVGTVTIHPILFYISFIVFVVLNTYKYCFFNLNIVYFSQKLLILILSISLVLGSLWALQSTTWGYIWVNDPVEWCLLFLVLYSLWVLHYLDVYRNEYNMLIFILASLSFLISIRLNLISTRHNFFNNTSVVYLVCLCVLIFFEIVFKSIHNIGRLCWQHNYKSYFYITFQINLNFALKYFLILSIFHGVRTRILLITKSSLLHFILFSVTLLWSSLFTFFFISYTFNSFVSEITSLIFTNQVNFWQSLSYFNENFFLLEQVYFLYIFTSFSNFVLFYKLMFLNFFNNYSLIPLLFLILFVCKNGWI